MTGTVIVCIPARHAHNDGPLYIPALVGLSLCISIYHLFCATCFYAAALLAALGAGEKRPPHYPLYRIMCSVSAMSVVISFYKL